MSLSTNTHTVRIEGISHFEIVASAEEIAEAVRLVMSRGQSEGS